MTWDELKDRQSWSLNQKIDHSLGVLEDFISKVGGVENVVISFSGGKDSTVLLHLARMIYPNIKSVFVNTGNEWPENIKFTKKLISNGYDIDVVQPEKTVKEVFEQHGFPLVSKELSERVSRVRRCPDCKSAKSYIFKSGSADRMKMIAKKWMFLIDEQFDISPMCCKILKKKPMDEYLKKTGRKIIVGTMADESAMRAKAYVQVGGCNSFKEGNIKSAPLSIWTENDIIEYIDRYNVEISEAYTKLNQKRTGCVVCGFGYHLSLKDGIDKFSTLKEYYPKYYDMVMNYENNGVKFKDALELCRK
jgi:3'-phosphoadenosine 5'-phosphosulfate sulfotransferase (PAPS reductase)/FAD synthetase